MFFEGHVGDEDDRPPAPATEPASHDVPAPGPLQAVLLLSTCLRPASLHVLRFSHPVLGYNHPPNSFYRRVRGRATPFTITYACHQDFFPLNWITVYTR